MTIRVLTSHNEYSEEQRKIARLGRSKSGYFLVLGLAANLGSTTNPVPTRGCICSVPGALLKVVSLVCEAETRSRPALPHTRICVELAGKDSPKLRRARANRIASGIDALFAHVHHTVYNDFELYQIPGQLIKGSSVSVEAIEQLEGLSGLPRRGAMGRRLDSFICIPRTSLAVILYFLPFVLVNDDLFNACSFFRACCTDYTLMDGVVGDVLREPRREPDTERERLALENVILQSFRTIEALVGEPGDDRRFLARLRSYGIRSDEYVGFPGKRRQKLADRIRWLQIARDSAAAHGKRRRDTPFTIFEAMEAQHIADAVLDRALWFNAESLGRTGDDDELRFLLAEMFGDLRDELTDSHAIKLARSPGGLKRVLRIRERKFRRSPLTAL